MDTHENISDHIAKVTEALLLLDQESIYEFCKRLEKVRSYRGTVWLVGNGGSASTASHFANDLRKIALINAIAMSDQVPMITAYGNDNGWDNMFAYPLRLYIKPDDCLVAISCSGNSHNVLEASKLAEPQQLLILTGVPNQGNILAAFENSGMVYVNCPDIKVQEDIHLIVCHAIASVLAQ